MEGLAGIASGVDTHAIVEKLMSLERTGRRRLDWRERQVTTVQAALKDIRTKLAALQTAADALRDAGLWTDTQTVESSDPASVSVRRLSGTGPGGYQVEVLALARAEQRTYAYVPPVVATTIEVGGVSVAVDAGATLDQVVAAVNARADAPVYAVAVDGSLVLSARTTGTASAFTATSVALVEDAAKARAGQDAQYRVDGGDLRTSSSNVVTGAIAGLELTLKRTTAAPVAVSVGNPGLDAAAVKEKVKGFVTAYNELVTATRSRLTEQRVRDPQNIVDASKGRLFGDMGLSSMLAQFRVLVADPVAGNPAALDELAELGISTGRSTGATATEDAKQGKLVLDEARLDAALAADPLGVRTLLGAAGVDGFTQKVDALAAAYDGGTSGILDKRIQSADAELERLRDQMAVFDQRLAMKEKRLKAQFAAMENALGLAQAQQAWLAGQLATLQPAR